MLHNGRAAEFACTVSSWQAMAEMKDSFLTSSALHLPYLCWQCQVLPYRLGLSETEGIYLLKTIMGKLNTKRQMFPIRLKPPTFTQY